MLETITQGILCNHAHVVQCHETDDRVHCIITPEKGIETFLRFQFSEVMINKSYLIQVDFHHEHAQVEIAGLYQLSDNQQVNIKTIMNHFVPHCVSKQVWRGVLKDESKATFEGTIVVHKNAQKTDAQLSNKNLLLSDKAHVNTKPQLQIDADDVKCAHGATVGCLDEQAVFYLRSRGISESEARAMLVNAFIEEVCHQ